MTTRIEDIKQLQLKQEWEEKLREIVYKNRIEWELWIESAKDYKDLRRKLIAKGITGVPISFSFLMSDMSSYKNPEKVNSLNISNKKTMTQRGNRNNN